MNDYIVWIWNDDRTDVGTIHYADFHQARLAAEHAFWTEGKVEVELTEDTNSYLLLDELSRQEEAS